MQEKKLKLNYKRTFYMGFAFFAILMLWQMYNYYCPLFLESMLGDSKAYVIGLIMAADNIFAIFMLPLFGSLSDKTHTKWGRRMPYLVVGMIASAICFPLIAVMYYVNSLVGLIIMMGLILIIMNIYRNPAVSLMPDVTPKPLRSQANGIINLVGYIGAVLGGAIAMIIKLFFNELEKQGIAAFIVASFFMILAVIILVLRINEPKIVEEMKDDMLEGEKLSESFTNETVSTPLTKQDKVNTIILLFSVLFWFISFNAVESFYSIFCKNTFTGDGLDKLVGTIVMAGLPLSSIITFMCTINLPVKIGRKNTVLIGLGCLILGFFIIVLQGILNKYIAIVFIISIVICGIGWALINANSYPMLVEVTNKDNVGKFTGWYYTFSMIAQSITPVLVGALITIQNKYTVLFIYALVTMAIAAIIFSFFKENRKHTIKVKKGMEKFEDND